MKERSLPLGIDIGTTRLRVAHAVQAGGGPQVRAVAVRDISAGAATSGAIADPPYIAALLEEAVRELKTRERRCVAAIGTPDASLQHVTLPSMTRFERVSAARFEAERYVEFPVSEAVVRIHRSRAAGGFVLGVVRRSILSGRVDALRRAGLRPVAIDHEACALARVFTAFDAVLDVGYERTALHAIASPVPATLHAPAGGAQITGGIAQDLAIDEHSAEKRKRILGIAGAGERALGTLVDTICALVRVARQTTPIVRMALTGNASRLAGLGAAVEAITGASCEVPVAPLLQHTAYPEDVLRSGCQDWTLAAALTTWSRR